MTGPPAGLARYRTVALAAVGGALVAVIGFGVPLGAVLTAGLLLMCPLMMLGMHGGHGHGSHGPGRDREDAPDEHVSGRG